MLLAAGPNWLGSPQHFFGGLALAFLLVFLSRLIGLATGVAGILAVGITCTVEILVELFEYPLMYAHHLHPTAYYDTLADMGNSLAGALVGVVVALIVIRRHRRARRRGQVKLSPE